MKKVRTKWIATLLALAIGTTPVIGCTTVPKANTNRSNGVIATVAEAKPQERKSNIPVQPEAKPAPETKPAVPPAEAKPETKPTVPPAEVKPETKPTVPPVQVKPETKPTVPPAEVKPETKPTVPPVQVKPETKPTVPPVQVKPETKPTPPPVQVKPETKPCKPCKPSKPAGNFTIDNFKIIQQTLEKLGVKPSELEGMIKEGKKLIDVLETKEIPLNKFRKMLYKEYCLAIQEGVKAGQISKEEGKLLKAAIKQKVMCWMKDK